MFWYCSLSIQFQKKLYLKLVFSPSILFIWTPSMNHCFFYSLPSPGINRIFLDTLQCPHSCILLDAFYISQLAEIYKKIRELYKDPKFLKIKWALQCFWVFLPSAATARLVYLTSKLQAGNDKIITKVMTGCVLHLFTMFHICLVGSYLLDIFCVFKWSSVLFNGNEKKIAVNCFLSLWDPSGNKYVQEKIT